MDTTAVVGKRGTRRSQHQGRRRGSEWVVVSDGESWARAAGKHGGGATGGAISLNGLARRPCFDANVSRTPRSIQPGAVALCWLFINPARYDDSYFVRRQPTISCSTAETTWPCSPTVQYRRADSIPATYESRPGRLLTTHRNHTSLSALLSYPSAVASVVW